MGRGEVDGGIREKEQEGKERGRKERLKDCGEGTKGRIGRKVKGEKEDVGRREKWVEVRGKKGDDEEVEGIIIGKRRGKGTEESGGEGEKRSRRRRRK